MIRPWSGIHISGKILTFDMLSRISEGEVSGTAPVGYGFKSRLPLEDHIEGAWRRVRYGWKLAEEQVLRGGDLNKAFRNWAKSNLLRELGYTHPELVSCGSLEIDDLSIPINHHFKGVPIHLLSPKANLDKRQKGVKGASKSSPHGTLLKYLNLSDEQVWGIVSNGFELRLVRQSKNLTKAPFIAFDLRHIFREEHFQSFHMMWLLCHQSRLVRSDSEAVIESWQALSQQEGVRALKNMCLSAEAFILILGQEFITHPQNHALRAQARQGTIDTNGYYHQLLRLVYRLVFLLVAESKALVLLPETHPRIRNIYDLHYSVSRLLPLAKDGEYSEHSDIWQSLVALMKQFEKGNPRLGIPHYGTQLWTEEACQDLTSAHCRNSTLLKAFLDLSHIKMKKDIHSVNWMYIDSEEIGSIYEHLLDLEVELKIDSIGQVHFGLKSSNARSRSGSYYTPDALVQYVLDTSLIPLVDSIFKDNPSKYDRERELLSLKVCDPTCGSGHFLVGASRRLGRVLAQVRSGDSEPSGDLLREAIRDVVENCIYGVDLNPMAVELCKISLWMETLIPGKPLSFLETKIKVGNALVGTVLSEVCQGIPNEAFDASPTDNPRTLRFLKEQNARFDSSVQVSNRADLEQLSNIWCGVFLSLKTKANQALICTQQDWNIAATGAHLSEDKQDFLDALIDQVKPLHWELVFPNVFTGNDSSGFDLIVGNPPFINQLAKGKALPRHQVQLISYNLKLTVGYADVASLIMLWTSRLLSRKGVIAMVQPLSIVATDSSGPVREQMLKSLSFTHAWATNAHIFDDAKVYACALTLSSQSRTNRIIRKFGNDFNPASPYVLNSNSLSEPNAKWSSVIAGLFGIPEIENIQTAEGLKLSDLATATAGFRDQYYGPKECVRELSEVHNLDHIKLYTSGTIHPLRSQFGFKPVRYNKSKFEAPVFPIAILKQEAPSILKWFKGLGGAKILVAQQSNTIRAVVDTEGVFYPMVPIVVVLPKTIEDIWKIAALLVSPVAAAWALTNFLGGAMHPTSIKVSAVQMLSIPLPTNIMYWERAAEHARLASEAQEITDYEKHLTRSGQDMCLSYGLEYGRLLDWWLSRLPRETK